MSFVGTCACRHKAIETAGAVVELKQGQVLERRLFDDEAEQKAAGRHTRLGACKTNVVGAQKGCV